uniref:G_PROTEIN_RECEP_F1_2 domain-containing protein n=1 Tax=Heterorhabditis bacteriophora TaxID=37862 RepID=A0A1I7WEY0_HETBA
MHLNNYVQEKVFKNQTAAKSAFEEFIGFRAPEFYILVIFISINKFQSKLRNFLNKKLFLIKSVITLITLLYIMVLYRYFNYGSRYDFIVEVCLQWHFWKTYNAYEVHSSQIDFACYLVVLHDFTVLSIKPISFYSFYLNRYSIVFFLQNKTKQRLFYEKNENIKQMLTNKKNEINAIIYNIILIIFFKPYLSGIHWYFLVSLLVIRTVNGSKCLCRSFSGAFRFLHCLNYAQSNANRDSSSANCGMLSIFIYNKINNFNVVSQVGFIHNIKLLLNIFSI